jgi:hypothetical protein
MSRTELLGVALSLLLSAGIAAGPGVPPVGGAGPSFQGDPQAAAEVQAAFQKFGTAPTWRARITAGGAGTQEMEHVAPDRYHMRVSQGNQQSEFFMIGRDAWLRSEGRCQKLPASLPMMNPREAIEHTGDAKIAVAKGGPEVIDGVSTQAYLLTVDVQGKQYREKLFVAAGTGLPRRIEIRSDQGATAIDYFDYGAQIAIKNPPC